MRWFGKDQEQLPKKKYNALYINHDIDEKLFDIYKISIVKILEKYFEVDWDYTLAKSIKIKDK